MSIRIAGLLVVALLQISCGMVGAGATSIAYSPQGSNVENAAEELRALILADTAVGCVTELQAMSGMFLVKAVCSYGVGNQVLRYGQGVSISMSKSSGWYEMRVKHSDNAKDFFWSSKSLKDAQHMADCVSALSKKSSAAIPASM